MDIYTINEVACNLIIVSERPENNTKFDVKKVIKNVQRIKVIPMTYFCEINYMANREIAQQENKRGASTFVKVA